MKTHCFTLHLSGITEMTPELADALYEATRGDIELNQRDSVVFVDVTRKARTLDGAIAVAIRELESAEFGLRVIRVESETATIIAKINAELTAAAASS